MLRGMRDIIILRELHEKPMHGYALITMFRRRFGVYLGPSSMYPRLEVLERKGYVVGEWSFSEGKPRKIYRLTPLGEQFLEEGRKGITIAVQPILLAFSVGV